MKRSLSPGEQPRTRSISIWRLLALLVPVLLVFWLWNTPYPPVREYKIYLTDDRQPAELPWTDLSETIDEATIRQRFQAYPLRCMPSEAGIPAIERVCILDLKTLNGVPTMTVHFLFAQRGLQRVATNNPWWSHAEGLASLEAAFGAPTTTQDHAHSGVRLHGWKLPSGAAVFYNRDPANPPLGTNSIQWLASDACSGRPCIN